MPNQLIPTRKTYTGLAVLCAILLVYGCWVPFVFRPLSFTDALGEYQKVLSRPVAVVHKMDWAVNILLFLPLGFLTAGAVAVDRRGGWLAALLCAPLMVLLSAGIEFVQLFIPKRVSSINDIVANGLGGCIGIGLWVLAGPVVTRWLRGFQRLQTTEVFWRRVLPAYLFGLFFLHLTPFDFTSPSDLWHKWKEGRIHLVPFVFPPGQEIIQLEKTFFNIAYFLPMGLILAGMNQPMSRDNPAAWKVLGVGFLLSSTVECLQTLIYSRDFQSTDILTGGMAVLFGWTIGRTEFPMSERDKSRVGILIGWCLGLAVMHWAPADWDWAGVEKRWSLICKVPFVDYFEKDYLLAFDKMFQKVLLFIPVGVLLGRSGIRHWLGVLLFAVLISCLLEGGQLLVASRFASVSDVILEPIGAVIGFWMMNRCLRSFT